MKNLIFILFLFLIACVDENRPVLWSEKTSMPGAVSWGTFQSVDWYCAQTEMSDKLVWVVCSFHNISQVKKDSTCIEIVYGLQMPWREVMRSRKLCSGDLESSAKSENYAAFIKKQREVLGEKCGKQLERCYMTVRVVPSISEE